MKNKKRIVALFAATVMIVSSLAGCGSKTDKPEGTQEAKAEKVLKEAEVKIVEEADL